MSQATNLLSNGGTAGGSVGCYTYSSNVAGIATSQVSVVTLPQRNVATLQGPRFSTSTTSATCTAISKY